MSHKVIPGQSHRSAPRTTWKQAGHGPPDAKCQQGEAEMGGLCLDSGEVPFRAVVPKRGIFSETI